MSDEDRSRGAIDESDDGELLARIRDRDHDARAAQAAFYARHVRYLYGVLLRHKKDLLGLAGISAEDLVQETFHRAFDRAGTFDRGDIVDRVRLEQRTRAWLGRIATNLLADHLHRLREVSASPYLERLSCEDIEAPPSRPSPKIEIVTRALEELTERERDVLQVSALYYRAGEHQRLPNAVSAELAGRWKTTNENIRAIRTRAMKKIKALLSEEGLGSEEMR